MISKLQELLDSKERARQADLARQQEHQAALEAAEMAREERDKLTLANAAKADAEGLQERLAVLRAKHEDITDRAMKAKLEYIAAIQEYKTVEEQATAITNELHRLNKYTLEPLPIRHLSNKLQQKVHMEPTPYISRAQIMAAYRGMPWQNLANSE